jgi:S-adenosylmethionine:tRNA ribosyltransferase-isomerase
VNGTGGAVGTVAAAPTTPQQPFRLEEFRLPPELEAHAPPEELRGGRDAVRLLLGRAPGTVSHHRFEELPQLLDPGDVLVVNTSATLPSAVDGWLLSGGGRGSGAGTGSGVEPVVVHFSTEDGPDCPPTGSRWVVELRTPDGRGSTRPRPGGPPGALIELAGGERLTLLDALDGSQRLWRAHFSAPDAVAHLRVHGRAIRYSYTDRDRPLAAYQTVFADALARQGGPPARGSAEMPSAGRPFTDALITALVSHGIQIAPLTLHTGVASVESHEPPFAEWFAVPPATARLVESARAAGSRVVAGGTTAVRALESAVDSGGRVRAAEGSTELVVTPERGVRVVDGLLTGLHEPQASHLMMLEAVVGRDLLERCYAEALRHRYLWHEMGDVNLLLAR